MDYEKDLLINLNARNINKCQMVKTFRSFWLTKLTSLSVIAKCFDKIFIFELSYKFSSNDYKVESFERSNCCVGYCDEKTNLWYTRILIMRYEQIKNVYYKISIIDKKFYRGKEFVFPQSHFFLFNIWEKNLNYIWIFILMILIDCIYQKNFLKSISTPGW